ncbi:hypothetical protein K7432_003350 [Basidiobolus ranarum]|uniref:Uncharacterized protein n=1 Tax=Basidiobolus ranarum TaxID=34480 RepID=A0ABR2W698_9FUNG
MFTKSPIYHTAVESNASTPSNAYEIGESIRAMDNKYNTSFQLWIRNPSNAQCIGSRLRRLGEECAVEQLALAMRWTAEGWSEKSCRVLFQHVTYRWPETRKKSLIDELLKPALTKSHQLPPLRNPRYTRRHTPYSPTERKRSISCSNQEHIVVSSQLNTNNHSNQH